jgi:hypothetical protein
VHAPTLRGKRMFQTICQAVSSLSAVSQLSKPVLPKALPMAIPNKQKTNKLNAITGGDRRAK